MTFENHESKKIDAGAVLGFLHSKGIDAVASLLNNELEIELLSQADSEFVESILRKSTLYYWFDKVTIRANAVA